LKEPYVTEFEGRCAIITGAARGLGAGFARALAERGAHVALFDVDGVAAQTTAEALRRDKFSAVAWQCDVTDDEQVSLLVVEVAAKFGAIDILINNAGLHSAEYNRPMAELGADRVRRLLDVNVNGTMICSLAVRDAMARRPGAAILNISSNASYPCMTGYGASKLAVRGLTAAFAHEFSGLGIRVNAVAPGLTFTDTIRAELPPETVAKVMELQLLKREGEVADIVEAMLYLCSDRARFITGATLRVDGGALLSI
jgi:3-oxoacyl-[acyl-carrier protein] reductase